MAMDHAVVIGIESLTPVFQQRLTERMAFPWNIALGSDFQYAATIGDRPEPTPTSLADGAYMKAVGELATTDVDAAEALFLMTHTFDPSQIRRPEIVAKVETWIAEGRRPPYPDPALPSPWPETVERIPVRTA